MQVAAVIRSSSVFARPVLRRFLSETKVSLRRVAVRETPKMYQSRTRLRGRGHVSALAQEGSTAEKLHLSHSVEG